MSGRGMTEIHRIKKYLIIVIFESAGEASESLLS